MEAYLIEWTELLVRWLHIIVGIAWIGSSFYFVMLDNSLKPPRKKRDKERGVHGEFWEVHGGGFYNSQKFLAGPVGESLPKKVKWSKWPAYTTWMSGMGLMALVYWWGATSYLIDPSVADLSVHVAVGISVGAIAVGWIVYDILCRVLGKREWLLTACVFVLVVASTWALHQVFSGRAAYIHIGAMMGTMMVANVFFHIIPGQRKMVAQIRAGEEVDPTPGLKGKQRSVHNTYFTLPVLFTMISSHYPMTYAHPNAWLILVILMLAGVFIRQFFVMRHQGKDVWWLWIVAIALILALVVAMAPRDEEAFEIPDEPISYAEIERIVTDRCVACHSEDPTYPGYVQPPNGIALDTPEQIRRHGVSSADTIRRNYMPIGNLTKMTEEERALFSAWVAQGMPEETTP